MTGNGIILQHELTHGSHLAVCLWERIGDSGNCTATGVQGSDGESLFQQYPHLKDAYDQAEEALANFYQVAATLKAVKA